MSMKNKVTLTITADEYKIEAVIHGERYGRHMKKEKRGQYYGQHIDCPDFEQAEDIQELLPYALDDLMMGAFDVADLLDFIGEEED